jgi:DNA-binding NarL/FixJ family response regulator
MERMIMTNKEQECKTGTNKTRIIIVDDHPIVREGLAGLINKEEDLVVCGQAEDADQAMGVVKTLKPDMVIVDISLKDRSGTELIKDINVQYPSLPVLVLSMHDESLYAERALRAGAKGYIMKYEATKKVVIGIRKVLSGQFYFSDRMATKMMHKLATGEPKVGVSPIECLSDRELEVFDLFGQGYGTHQIAEHLHLSMKTIETHRLRTKKKLNVTGTAELLRHAFQWVESRG